MNICKIAGKFQNVVIKHEKDLWLLKFGEK